MIADVIHSMVCERGATGLISYTDCLSCARDILDREGVDNGEKASRFQSCAG
jgi:hypothetical protein